MNKPFKLTNKVFIGGTIECLTGLRIGGNKSSLEIGGVDLSVIKDAAGVPYLPGSSIKGKLRSLLGKISGAVNADADAEDVKLLFGSSGSNDNRENKQHAVTRLYVRDASLDTIEFKKSFPDASKRDFAFSETKTENVIDRSTGKAQHPRTIERVPAGAIFNFSMVIDAYDGDDITKLLGKLGIALELLQYDYLGGHGTRGSGQVKISITNMTGKSFSESGVTDMNGDSWQSFVKRVNETNNQTT